jgi:hypothetical protein
LGEVIERYTKETVRDIGRTKAQVLRSIKSYGIANMACSKIASADIAAFAQQLAVQPQTVGNYLSHLAAVFAIAIALGLSAGSAGHEGCASGRKAGRNHQQEPAAGQAPYPA